MSVFILKYLWEITEIILFITIIFLFLIFNKTKNKKLFGVIFSVFAIILVSMSLFCEYSPPIIELVGGKELSVEVFEEYQDRGIIICDHAGRVVDTEVTADTFDVDTDILGNYHVTYSFRYKGRTFGASRLVHVVDTTPPKILFVGDDIIAVEAYEDYQEPGCIAIDNYNGDISQEVTVSYSGDRQREILASYTVTDSSGNKANLLRKIEIRDITPPKLSLKGYKCEVVIRGSKYNEKGCSAYDNLDGDISANIEIFGTVDTSTIGTYVLEYTVVDSEGNASSLTRRIRVVEPEKAKDSVIYLSFDDGPSEYTTKEILNVLKKNNVKATFFIINFDTKAKADLIKRMLNEGHTVAIHGYSHVFEDIYRSEKAFMHNVNSLREKVEALTGYTPSIMRFPGGSSNTYSAFNPGIMTTLVESVQDEGYIYYDWNVDSGDSNGKKYNSNDLFINVKTGLRKNNRNVVLMHDITGGDIKAKAVQKIIDYGKKNGYVFLPITEATTPVRHIVRN